MKKILASTLLLIGFSIIIYSFFSMHEERLSLFGFFISLLGIILFYEIERLDVSREYVYNLVNEIKQ